MVNRRDYFEASDFIFKPLVYSDLREIPKSSLKIDWKLMAGFVLTEILVSETCFWENLLEILNNSQVSISRFFKFWNLTDLKDSFESWLMIYYVIILYLIILLYPGFPPYDNQFNFHAGAMAVARPYGSEIYFVKSPISGSAAWFFVNILKFIFTSIFEIKFMKKILETKKFHFRCQVLLANIYLSKVNHRRVDNIWPRLRRS